MARTCDIIITCTEAATWRRKLGTPTNGATTEAACEQHKAEATDDPGRPWEPIIQVAKPADV